MHIFPFHSAWLLGNYCIIRNARGSTQPCMHSPKGKVFPPDSPLIVCFLSNGSHDAFGALGHMAGLLHTSAQIIEREQALGSQALVRIWSIQWDWRPHPGYQLVLFKALASCFYYDVTTSEREDVSPSYQ